MIVRVAAAALMMTLAGAAFAQSEAPKAAEQPAKGTSRGGEKAAENEAPKLRVGDPAPKLTIEKWVKGDEVKSFEDNKVYVVEFWATWCPPCRKSIPHLSELQSKFKDKGVTIIGVSSSERRGLPDVEPFVTKQGDKMAYTVAWDDNGKTNKAYMDASGQEGIPTAFIVDQSHRIAWIGHPMDGLDEMLAKVVAKEFDVDKAAREAKRRAEIDEKARPLIEKAEEAMAANDKKKVIEQIDQIIAIDPPMQGDWVFNKFHMLAVDMQDTDKAYAYANEVSTGSMKDNAQVLNSIAWVILDDEGITKRDLPLAKRLSERANTLTGDKSPAVMDTYARALFETGEKDKAVEVQSRAVQLAPEGDMKDELQKRLDDFKKRNVKG